MAALTKCPTCGQEIAVMPATNCPMCGTGLVSPRSPKVWIGALIQIAITTTFMLLFRFPTFMIVPFVLFILLGTALSVWIKSKTGPPRPAAPLPLAHPTLFRIVILGIAICGFVLVSSVLFGFVIFMNSWNRWHLYEGQSYHHTEFQVTQVYFRKGLKGAVDAYASGTVEGQREWMNLIPYLHRAPRSEAELDSLVGPGDTIPILYFQGMKGRFRTQFDDGTPPAEAAQRDAMNALKYGCLGFAVSAGLVFVLNRLRRLCFVPTESSYAASAS